MAEIKDYSVTADDNNSASPNGMPENMAPSGVNNSWRESFARVKRWYEDINATKSTTGSSNAYVLAAARTVTAYAQGDAYMFRANHANTGAATLNIDSVGAVEIVNNTQSALAAGQIQAGGIYLVAYDATNSKFQLVGASATSASGDNIFVFNASPSVTLSNSTAEDSDGGRESTIQWKGLQSGSEESTLVKIIGSHDGSSDDQKGKLQIYTNDGSDGDSPTLQVTIDSAGLCTLVGAASIGGSLTVAGATQLNSTVTVGADDQGYDVILYGDTASANVTWDTSVDDLILNGAAGLIVPDGQLTLGSTAVTSTGAELNYNDTGAAVGTVVASKTVTVDANKDVSSFRNITLTGELDAGSLDVSGNADIDGTLEADAITLNGTALGSLYSPIAGSSSIVTTGALDAGSITSGFGAIDNGSSAITTTGVITGGTVEATTDTAAGDNAAIGYTSAEGLILTGQGSTSDVTIKNDADATVLSIPTGTTNVGIGTTSASKELELGALDVFRMQTGSVTMDCTPTAGATDSFVWNTSVNAIYRWDMNGTERMRIDSSGNVGIGTTAPAAPLDVVANSADALSSSQRGRSADNLSIAGFFSNDGATRYSQIRSASDRLNISAITAIPLVFDTSGTERMRIDSSGNVGIGTSSPEAQLHVKNGGGNSISILGQYGTGTKAQIAAYSNQVDISAYNGTNDIMTFTTGVAERMRINSDGRIGVAVDGISGVQFGMKINGQDWFFVCDADDGTDKFRVASSGNVQNANNSYGSTSDIKLKENIVDASNKLEELKQVRIRNFNFKGDSQKQIGVIAQELETIFPSMVEEHPDLDEDGEDLGTVTKSVKYSVFVPILIKAMQEQQTVIESLEARITALEAG